MLSFVLRCVAFTFFIANLSYFAQFPGLWGYDGLSPVAYDMLSEGVDSPLQAAVWNGGQRFNLPVDSWVMLLSLGGAALGLAMSLGWFCTAPMFLLLTTTYRSLLLTGGPFMSFQWDILLCEVGMVCAIVAHPILSRGNATSWKVSLLPFAFVAFKLMLMSGTVKIQSQCPTWVNLTATMYHHATQCLPTPLAWYFDKMPPVFHQVSVAGILYVQMAGSLLLLVPVYGVAAVGVLLHVASQVLILLSGNYNFFNWISIVLCLAPLGISPPSRTNLWFSMLVTTATLSALGIGFMKVLHLDSTKNQLKLRLSDQQVSGLVVSAVLPTAAWLLALSVVYCIACDVATAATAALHGPRGLRHTIVTILRVGWRVAVTAMVLLLLCANLIQFRTIDPSNAIMNQYLPTELHDWGHYGLSNPHFTLQPYVSSYGLFRRMTGVGQSTDNGIVVARPEVVIEGSLDGKEWAEFEFLHKPGNPSAAPTFVAPHQPRLDWQMWFAALGHPPAWLVHLVFKILQHEPANGAPSAVMDLMPPSPFGNETVKFIRAKLYHYRFAPLVTKKAGKREPKGKFKAADEASLQVAEPWWRRDFVQDYLPFMHKDEAQLKKFLTQNGWYRRATRPVGKGVEPLLGQLEALSRAVHHHFHTIVFAWPCALLGLTVLRWLYGGRKQPPAITGKLKLD